ncbi:hypothetical protein LZ30DRAFT_766530 [Colletotrichum cereale]|nr:hypothetical protein LZ30DRAFT_766530 [Colletotrichum cereale]
MVSLKAILIFATACSIQLTVAAPAPAPAPQQKPICSSVSTKTDLCSICSDNLSILLASQQGEVMCVVEGVARGVTHFVDQLHPLSGQWGTGLAVSLAQAEKSDVQPQLLRERKEISVLTEAPQAEITTRLQTGPPFLTFSESPHSVKVEYSHCWNMDKSQHQSTEESVKNPCPKR